jgi:hypothetical protein
LYGMVHSTKTALGTLTKKLNEHENTHTKI